MLIWRSAKPDHSKNVSTTINICQQRKQVVASTKLIVPKERWAGSLKKHIKYPQANRLKEPRRRYICGSLLTAQQGIAIQFGPLSPHHAQSEWNPVAIKSALFADHVDKTGGRILDSGNSYVPSDIFATGAGHIGP
ncbi:hypothetical protein SUGI_0337050 [Cryptomeria japonica]|nr:hypothetical protein SUGI_0337050 [Cryptomeria japonica]